MKRASADRAVGLVADPVFEDHDTGPAHPESPERLARLRAKLEEDGLVGRAHPVELVEASDDLLERVHDRAHIARCVEACRRGDLLIDSMDTAIGSSSERIARLAAGSLTHLARLVARGELERGFAAVRPPGHHAERDLAMGFCLYNNVAVAAEDLIAGGLASRVLIVDWDVHHGNGTQHIFEERGDVFYFSLHQWPLYPGTGARAETGRGAGLGATLNCPLPPGAGDGAFLAALEELVPVAERFAPDFVLISAGFDAHARDPLAQLEVSTEAYGDATRMLVDLALRHSRGRIVSVLEGGYDLAALGASASLHLRTLLEHSR